MKLDEILKYAETTLRDLVLFFLEYFRLVGREHKEEDTNKLDINNGKLWVIVIVSTFVVCTMQQAARGQTKFEIERLPTIAGIYLWKVFVFSLVMHANLKILGCKTAFTSTLSQALQGFSAIGVAAAFLAYSVFVAIYVSPVAESISYYNKVSVMSYEVFKIMFVMIFLAPRLSDASNIEGFRRVVIFLVVPIATFAIDCFFSPLIRIYFYTLWLVL